MSSYSHSLFERVMSDIFNYCLQFCFFLRWGFSVYSLDWPRTFYIDQVGLELRPPPSLDCW